MSDIKTLYASGLWCRSSLSNLHQAPTSGVVAVLDVGGVDPDGEQAAV